MRLNIKDLSFDFQMWLVIVCVGQAVTASRLANMIPGQPEIPVQTSLPTEVDNSLSPFPYGSGTYHFVSTSFPGNTPSVPFLPLWFQNLLQIISNVIQYFSIRIFIICLSDRVVISVVKQNLSCIMYFSFNVPWSHHSV